MIGHISGSDKAVSNYGSSQQSNTAGDLLFEKISNVLGSDGTKITKEQVENYVLNSQFNSSDTKNDDRLDFLTKLLAKWDRLSGDSDTMTKGEFTSGLGYIQNQNTDSTTTTTTLTTQKTDSDNEVDYDKTKTSFVANSFESLAAAVGAVGGKISKEQLMWFLQSLETGSASSGAQSAKASTEEITFVKNLLAQFSTLAGGGDYITSLAGLEEPQDYTTVTTAQVTPPIDIKI